MIWSLSSVICSLTCAREAQSVAPILRPVSMGWTMAQRIDRVLMRDSESHLVNPSLKLQQGCCKNILYFQVSHSTSNLWSILWFCLLVYRYSSVPLWILLQTLSEVWIAFLALFNVAQLWTQRALSASRQFLPELSNNLCMDSSCGCTRPVALYYSVTIDNNRP